MNIRPVENADAAEWLRMRLALWTDTDPASEAREIERFLTLSPRTPSPTLQAVFVCPRPDTGLCGLAEVGIRPYVDGCDTDNVGYLEGWYVDPDVRGQGIGRALVMQAETWARRQGCREFASDADLDNVLSQTVHRKLGFVETGRVVQFCKRLDAPSG